MPRSGQLPQGNEATDLFGALANPQRLRVIAALAQGARYVSQLARDLEISRPLLQVHLKKLTAAGLVVSRIEVSDDGKAMRFYELTSFMFEITPTSLAAAARTLHPEPPAASTRKALP